MKTLRLSILLLSVLLPGLLSAQNGKSRPSARGKDQDMAIIVNFPDAPIPIPKYKSFWNWWGRLLDFNRDNLAHLGHTGVILVDGVTGNLAYYDFGRYDDRNDLTDPRPQDFGTVRSVRHVPGMAFKIKARIEKGWITNIDTILVHLAAKRFFRNYGRIQTAVVYNQNLGRMIAKAREYEDRNYIFYGAPTHEYCTRFVREVVRAGGDNFGILTLTGSQTVAAVRRRWKQ